MLLSYTIDRLSALYLICFGLGLVMSIGSLLLGGHSHDFSGSSEGGPHAHIPDHILHVHHSGSSQAEPHVPLFNMNTFLAFLLGFGAAGFSAQQLFIEIPLYQSIGIAVFIGIISASLIYFFLSKILIRGQSAYLKESDFDLCGVEGIVS